MGRPMVWSLALEGATGVWMMLERLRDALDATMGMGSRTAVARAWTGCAWWASPLDWRGFPRPACSASGCEAWRAMGRWVSRLHTGGRATARRPVAVLLWCKAESVRDASP